MHSRHRTRTIASHVTNRIAVMALALGLVIAGAFLAFPSHAQEAWLERSEIMSSLSKSYTEAPIGLGLAANGAVIELFTTPDGATWTLIMTLPNGLSQILGSGEAWITIPKPVKGRVS